MKKRGQFYLIAAIIIITLILGFVAISNYSKTKSSTKVYDLAEELGIESGKVLDFGTYSEYDKDEMSGLLKGFSETYIDYAGEGRNLYFIFGNYDKITVVAYQDLTSGELSVEGGDSPLKITKGTSISGEFFPKGQNKVKIIINEAEFEFELKAGENFYFVLFQEIGGEQHVITG